MASRAPAAEGVVPTCTADVMFILDASGSMAASDFPEGAPNRFDRVRQALSRVVPDVARVRRLGLAIYGPGAAGKTCSNITVPVVPSPNASQHILDAAERALPQGRTPLVASVETAIEVLRAGGTTGEVVALTDGEDTCGRDPCSYAKQLHAREPELKVHVIGYRLAHKTQVETTRCLARETGGTFSTAETTDDLIAALRKALGCPQLSSIEQARPNTGPAASVE